MTVKCKTCDNRVTVPDAYKNMTVAQVEAKGLQCPDCLRREALDALDSVGEHLFGIASDMVDAGATALTAIKQATEPATRRVLVSVRDRLNRLLEQQPPDPPQTPPSPPTS